MAKVNREDPLKELATMQERMNKIFGEIDTGKDLFDSEGLKSEWSPPVDIYETGTELILKAEIPEVAQDDLSIEIQNNRLTIKGERKLHPDIKREHYHRLERPYGCFCREFTLPTFIHANLIVASYKEGVLTVTVPKREGAKPKQIKIDVK